MLKVAVSVVFVLLAAAAQALPAAAATIASHRAVYDLALDTARNSAGLIGAEGRMAFELSGSSCEGWTINFRMVNRFQPADDRERVIDTRSSSWESGDGLEMRYSQSEFLDNSLDNETMLSARLEPGGGGSVEMTKPEAKTFSISQGSTFPVQHQIKLMEAAERGESRDASLVYDGSDGDKSYRTITFIGSRREPGKSGVTYRGPGADRLAALPSWPISISHFDEKTSPEDAGEQTPIYQVGFIMFSNGVAAQLLLDYGDFAMRGNLTSLEFIDQPPCN